MKRTVNSALLTFTLSLFTLLAASPAKADLLYFMVNGYSEEGTKYNFDYAVLGVAKNVDDEWMTDWGAGGKSVYLNIQPTADSAAGASKVLVADNSGTYSLAGPAWADVSEYTASCFAFYVATYKYGSADAIWDFDETTAQGYTQLLKAGHVYSDSTALQDVTPWSVPEPSSGLLALLGLAGLALRRGRRRIRG